MHIINKVQPDKEQMNYLSHIIIEPRSNAQPLLNRQDQ